MSEKELTPQQRANRRQNEQRRHLPKIPTLVISEEEAALLNELAIVYGSKKAAIMAGLHALKRGLKPD